MGLNVYVGGTFDLFHYGHVEMLAACKRLAGKNGTLTVAINTDEFVERFKNKRPVMSFDERLSVIQACKYVDYAIENYGDEDSRPVILEAGADLVVTGSDWLVKDYMKQMSFTEEWLQNNGVGVVFLPYTRGISSTEIRQRLALQ